MVRLAQMSRSYLFMNRFVTDDVAHPSLSAGMIERLLEQVPPWLEEQEGRQVDLERAAGPVRDEMLRNAFIRPAAEASGRVIPLRAVDAASEEAAVGTIHTSLALAFQCGEDAEPLFESGLLTGPNSEAFRHLSGGHRLQLELRLLARAATSVLTIVDNSYWSLLMAANKVITAYQNLYTIDEDAPFRGLILEGYDSAGERTLLRTLSNPDVIAMSKLDSGSAICKMDAYENFFNHEVSDRTLLSRVLRPGERTRELAIKTFARMGLSGSKVNVEQRFISERDRRAIEEIFHGRLYVTFYRPWVHTRRPYRIEFHRDRFPDSDRLSDLFATIKHATRFPTILEPFPQALADSLCQGVHPASELFGRVHYYRFPDILGLARTSDL